MKKRLLSLFIVFSFFTSLYCETAEPYTYEEFPGVLHDLRRAEIITLGAMPFITFNVSLGYSFGKYVAHDFDANYFVNPFDANSDNGYSTDEQIGIILASVGISAGIGLTDFIVHSIKRNNQYRKQKRNKNNDIVINPITQDEEATKIEKPDANSEEKTEDTSEISEETATESSKTIKSPKAIKVMTGGEQ